MSHVFGWMVDTCSSDGGRFEVGRLGQEGGGIVFLSTVYDHFCFCITIKDMCYTPLVILL